MATTGFHGNTPAGIVIFIAFDLKASAFHQFHYGFAPSPTIFSSSQISFV